MGMDHMDHMGHMDQAHELLRLPMPAAPGVPFSEFNHHLAGIVVLIMGVSALLMYARPRTFSSLKYVWPLALIGLGLYLVIYSDPNSWPVAYTSISQSLADHSTFQHKVFALLLLAIGGIELARVSGIVRSRRWKYGFPALALFGALYLIVHEHGGGASEHMIMDEASMELIRKQHMLFLGLGVGIAFTRVLYDVRAFGGTWIRYFWPTLTIILGLALIFYRELP